MAQRLKRFCPGAGAPVAGPGQAAMILRLLIVALACQQAHSKPPEPGGWLCHPAAAAEQPTESAPGAAARQRVAVINAFDW